MSIGKDEIALEAMKSLIIAHAEVKKELNGEFGFTVPNPGSIAKISYEFADAMIKEREK